MFIYVIGTDTIQKIGYSGDVNRRLSSLQVGNSEKLTVHFTVDVPPDQVKKVEKTIHREYNHLRVKGEWFRMTPEQAKLCVQHAAIRWVVEN